MKAFRERFQSHPLSNSIKSLWELIESIDLRRPDESSDEDREEIRSQRNAFARFLRVSTYITRSIERSDPTLWTPSALNQAHQAVSTLEAGVKVFATSLNEVQLLAAGDTSLDQFRDSLIQSVPGGSRGLAEAFSGFCERAEASIHSLEDHEAEIKNYETAIKDAEQAFGERIKALEAELEQFRAQFEAQKSRVDELVTNHQQAFSNGQTERVAAFKSEADGREEEFAEWKEEAWKEVKALHAETKAEAVKHLQVMEDAQNRAKEILGIVAASGVSGHYKKTAFRELVSAEVLRVLALACFVTMGIVIYHVVESVRTPEFRWEIGLFRLGVGFALAVPAYYCARESSKHREAEKRNRRLHIELATLEPYLEKLHNDEEVRAILKAKAESYFIGQTLKEPNDDVEGEQQAKNLRRWERQVIEIIKAVAGSVKQ